MAWRWRGSRDILQDSGWSGFFSGFGPPDGFRSRLETTYIAKVDMTTMMEMMMMIIVMMMMKGALAWLFYACWLAGATR